MGLVASELFGHEKGAFTGALQRRLGRFESADGGTLFLDEVGELPPEAQVALLRVLQDREFERVGGSQTISVDVRVLAATNKDLGAAVAEGSFREDLFYRLNVFPLRMPALRERRDDIPILVKYLVKRYAERAGKSIRHINKRTLDLFQAYDWPGNVRELQNVIERAVILCDGETFAVDDTWLTPVVAPHSVATRNPLVANLVEHEREVIEHALREAEGVIGGPPVLLPSSAYPGKRSNRRSKSWESSGTASRRPDLSARLTDIGASSAWAVCSVSQATLDRQNRPRRARDADGPTPRIQQTLKERPATDSKVPVIKRLSAGAALALNRGDDPENRISV